jgi:hypothetical protein
MGLGKFLGPRLRKVKSMADIRVKISSPRLLQSGSATRNVPKPESMLALTGLNHPLRMHPPNWNEQSASKAQEVSTPPTVHKEQVRPQPSLLEAQTEADLKELVPTGFRPRRSNSTSSDVPYGWKVLQFCVGWGRHFQGFQIKDEVTTISPVTGLQLIITPPTPTLPAIESTRLSPSVPVSTTPQLAKSYPIGVEYTNRYRGSDGKGLPPLTYQQQLDLKRSQSTHIGLLTGNRIPDKAYLKVPQLRQPGKAHLKVPQPELNSNRDSGDARDENEVPRTQMATGPVLKTPVTLESTRPLPTPPTTPQITVSVGKVVELPTITVQTTPTVSPVTYPRYYARRQSPRLVLPSEEVQEAAPTNTLRSRRWSFKLGAPDVLNISGEPEEQYEPMMTSALTQLEPEPSAVDNDTATDSNRLPASLRIGVPRVRGSFNLTRAHSSLKLSRAHRSITLSSLPPSLRIGAPRVSSVPDLAAPDLSLLPVLATRARSAPATPRRSSRGDGAAVTFRDVDRTVGFLRDRRLAAVLRARERADAVAELRDLERVLRRLRGRRSEMFMARVARDLLERRE